MINKQEYRLTKALGRTVPCHAPQEKNANTFSTLCTHLISLETGSGLRRGPARYYSRGCQRPLGNSESQKFNECPINSNFIGLGLLRTVFEIVVACGEGPAPELCGIAGDIAG